MIEIINKYPKFRGDICQRVNSNKKISTLNRNQFFRISSPFSELMNSETEKANLDELKTATSKARDKEFAKIRKLERDQNGGFILISGLTCIGTIIVGTAIFMAIKFIVLK